MNTRILGRVALACATFTTLWVVLLVILIAGSDPVENQSDAIRFAQDRDIIYTLQYANAMLLTVTAAMVMAGLYNFTRVAGADWAIMGLVFVPVYAVLNLFAYGAQITAVPLLADTGGSDALLAQMVQIWGDSVVAVVNNLGYAALAIPSIIYGALLLRDTSQRPTGSLRAAAWLLVASGAGSLLSTLGLIVQIEALVALTIPAGVVFLLSVTALAWGFLRMPAPEPV